MVKIYFVCMGNYYRSRLAEELALYYAARDGLQLEVDSGGLSDVARTNNPGPIARATLLYLKEKGIKPKGAERYPKHCDAEIIYASDIVVCTDRDEQLMLFEQEFPDFSGELICWQAHDHHADPQMDTPSLIDRHVQELIQQLKKI